MVSAFFSRNSFNSGENTKHEKWYMMSVKDIKVFGLILWDHRKQLVRILVQDLSSSIANEKRNNNCESSKHVCNFYKPLSTINALTRAVQRVYLKNVRTFFHVPQSIIDFFLLCLWVSDGKCVCLFVASFVLHDLDYDWCRAVNLFM